MASIGLRIRQPGNVGVNVSGLADSLASAFFGDAGTEMALAKMRSQLATDAYQRQQAWQASELYRAKRETEEQNLEWRRGGIDPLTKILSDAQGQPVASDAGPVPVVLPDTTQALPQLRPSGAEDYVPPTSYDTTEPDVQVSPANYPLKSDEPVEAGPGGVEPDMSFGAYGVPAGGPALPPTAPVPARRPGDMPDMASYLAGTLGVPPELLPGAQAAPVNTVRPERAGDLRPTIVDSGSPSTFPARPELPGSLAPTGVPMPDLLSAFPPRPAQIGSNVQPYQLPPGAVPATGDSFLTLGDLWNHLIGQPPRRPEFDQPVSFGGDSGPATPFYNEEGLRNLIANGGREGTRANAQLIPPDRPSIWSAPGPFPARPGAPAPAMSGPVPIDLQPRPPMETGRRPGNFPPFEPNQALEGPPPPQLRPALPPGAYPAPSLAGVPPDLLPTPVDVPLPGYVLNEGLPQDVPPELTLMTGGTSVAVPGRNPPMPDTRQLAGVPPELQALAQPGGPAVTVPGRTTQETVSDRPPPVSPDYPIAPDAMPITATGDILLEPATQTVVVHTQSGPARLSLDQLRGLAGSIMGSSTSATDLATGTGRMSGLLGMTYGDPGNYDQQLRAATEYTGQTPGEKDQIVGRPSTAATGAAALTDGPYSGDSVEGQNQNVIYNVQHMVADPAAPVTPDMARLYDAAVTAAYGGQWEVRSGPDETTIEVFLPGKQRISLVSPTEVYRRAGMTAPTQRPKPAAVSDGEVPPADTQAAPAVSSTGEPTQPQVTTTGGNDYPPVQGGKGDVADVPDTDVQDASYDANGRVHVLLKGKRKMTEAMARNTGFYIVANRANQSLDQYNAKNIPTIVQTLLTDPSNLDWRARGIGALIEKQDPSVQKYWIDTANFANAVLRNESGAATRPEELAIVYQRFLPQPQDSDATLQQKAQYRDAVLTGLRLGAIGEAPTANELVAYAQQHVAAPAETPETATSGGTMTVQQRQRLEELRRKKAAGQ